MGITLHHKHGLAPALMFCRICGKDTDGIALLGNQADKVMREVYEASHAKAGGLNYHEYGHNRIPDSKPCKECREHLKTGTIFIAEDTGEYFKMPAEAIEQLQGRIADAKGRLIDFKACVGRIITMKKAWWVDSPEGIRLRDPKEWTDV